jgi:hypothetical protein
MHVSVLMWNCLTSTRLPLQYWQLMDEFVSDASACGALCAVACGFA